MEWFAMAHTLGEAHRRGQPHKVLHLTSYDRLEEYLRAFAQGHFNLLILVGAGGLSRRCGITCGPGSSRPPAWTGPRSWRPRPRTGAPGSPPNCWPATPTAAPRHRSRHSWSRGEDAGRPSSTTAANLAASEGEGLARRADLKFLTRLRLRPTSLATIDDDHSG